MYQFIKPFLENKMSIFEEYGAFKDQSMVICKDNLYNWINTTNFCQGASNEYPQYVFMEK